MTCSCCVFFLGMVRKKRGGRGGWGEDAWSVKYECTLICCKELLEILSSEL